MRRTLAALVIVACVLGSGVTPAQDKTRVARIGYITPNEHAARDDAFRTELAGLGWVEGRNLHIEYRSAKGQFERLPALAAEVVKLDVDVIVAVVTQASVAAKSATTKIPIVMVGVGDPVGARLVTSLARPGANVTGTSGAAVDVVGKQLELLRETRPGIARVVALRNPSNPVFQTLLVDEAKAAATRLGIELSIVDVRSAAALDDALKRVPAHRPEALLVLADPMLATIADRIARFAVEQRLPAVSAFETYTDAGILLAYGANLEQFHRRAAVYVDRILRGAKPDELPVERPLRFELVVNLRTARAIGMTLPPSLVSRADRVVQ